MALDDHGYGLFLLFYCVSSNGGPHGNYVGPFAIRCEKKGSKEYRLKDLNEYLLMGGDGVFIWSSYLVAAVLLLGMAGAILLRNKKLRRHKSAVKANSVVKNERSDTYDKA